MQFLLTLLFLAASALAAGPAFEQNLGQAGDRALFFTSTPTSSVLFTRDSVEFLAADASGKQESLRLMFPGAQPFSWQASAPHPEIYNYHIAGPAPRSASGVRRFERIQSNNVYPGIDLVFYFSSSRLEYDFIVHPGADPSAIQLQFAAPHRIMLSSDGDFQSTIGGHRWLQHAPLVHQQGRTIASAWHNTAPHRYRFSAGTYDPTQPLTIDPVLEFASYLGGEADDEVTSIGESFVAGNTTSILLDGVNVRPRRGRDVFIRIQASPSLAPAAYLPWRDQVYIFGGSADDSLIAAAVSLSSTSLSIAFAGTTSSTDLPFNFPVSRYKGGASDGYVAQYSILRNQSGATQNTSFSGSYYGGSGADRVTAALPGGQAAYIAGVTDSTDLPINRAIQATPGGGLDAFYAYIQISSTDPFAISSYFGGPGNDEALLLRFTITSTLLIGGESRSESVPQLPGSLSGPSDAFLLELVPQFAPITGQLVPDIPLLRARRFGGSGEDRLKVASSNSTSFLLAGETTSTDFPTQSPVQASLGGGTDAFILRFSPNGTDLLSSTYFGGSGDEVVRSGASVFSGEFLLAGDTTSPNLPTRDPLQPALAGARDGFYAFYSRAGELDSSSYYGGSGEESIYAIFLPLSGPFRLGGSSNSPNLPERIPWRQGAPGAIDGFVAEISLPFINVGDLVWAAPNLISRIAIRTSQPLRSTTLTARISDPSLATFVLGDQRSSEITFGASTNLAVVGLAEQGETSITLSAPGYATRQIRVRLGRAVLNIPPTTSNFSVFLRGIEFRPRLDILDTSMGELVPQTTFVINTPSFPITWRSSNPEIFRTLSTNNGNILVVPVSAGTAFLQLESRYPSWPEGGQLITVDPGVLSGNFFQPQIATPHTFNSISAVALSSSDFPNHLISGAFRVESEDPSRLLIGSSAADAVVAVDYLIDPQRATQTLNFPVVALASSGSVRVRISSPVLTQDAFVTVELRPLVVDIGLPNFNDSVSPSLTSLPNTRYPLGSSVRPDIAQSRPVIPTGPIQLNIESTNPQVARLSSSTWTLGPQATNPPSIELLSLGNAQLRATTNTPHVRIGNTPAVVVTNRLPFPLLVASPVIVVGNRLSTFINTSLSVNLNNQSDIELTVDDPTLVGISVSGADAPSASIRLRPSFQLAFLIHGLASSGTTTIRARSTNYEEFTFTVRLGPSGFAFNEERRSVDISSPVFSASVGAWVLDESTLEPLEIQSLQPGITANISIASSSSDLLLSRTSCSLSGTVSCIATVTPTTPGDYSVQLDPVPGFLTPAVRQRLNVRVQRTPITSAFLFAVKDCLVSAAIQTPFSFQGFAQPVSLRITSLDPELVLFSTTADQPGQTSITFDSNRNFFIHGMGPTGVARFRLDGPNIDPIESSMQIYNWTFRMERAFFNNDLPVDTLLSGSKYPYNIVLASTSGGSTFGTRPGIPPIRFDSQIQNPSVLGFRLTTGEPTFPPGTGFRVGDVSPLNTGTSSISFTSGTVRSDAFTFNIRLPRLRAASPLLPPNSRLPMSLQMENGAPIPTDNTIFTVRSLDPSRALVQTSNSGAPGAASISALWPVGSNTASFQVDSLSVTAGESEIEVSFPGFEPFIGRAYFATPALQFNSFDVSPTVVAGTSLDLPVILASLPRTDLAGRADINTSTPAPFRPGFDPASIPIEVEVDNPSLLSVDAPPARLGSFSDARPVKLKPLASGTATVRLLPPPGFATLPAAQSARAIRIQAPSLGINCQVSVPYESLTSCGISVPANVPLTIRSESAGRLLLSVSRTSPAQQELVAAAGSGFFNLTFHGLARSGSTKVTFSAPGYLDGAIDVPHSNTGFVIIRAASGAPPDPIAINGQLPLTLAFYGINPDGRPNFPIPAGLRPGTIPVVVPIRIADPSVVSVTPASVTFSPGEYEKSITVRGLKSGSTSVELGTPAGFAPPLPAGVLVRVN